MYNIASELATGVVLAGGVMGLLFGVLLGLYYYQQNLYQRVQPHQLRSINTGITLNNGMSSSISSSNNNNINQPYKYHLSSTSDSIIDSVEANIQ